ncbi:MAG TPA: hypothetical protein VLB72_04680 [Burkholderiales bacterium]|nr:hypothetical protein [Burkholderiales bacterium]
MINSSNSARNTGSSILFALAVTWVATSAALAMGAVSGLTSDPATPGISAASAAADTHYAYFPAQYVNQATEIEPLPPTF